MKRIPSLDGLRAVSIFAVLIGHILIRCHVPTARIAHLGVQTFFVISGYLITTLLQREQEKTGAISLRAFYRRRCFRIFPAACVFIGIMAALVPASRSGMPYALTYTTSYFLSGIPGYLQHLWSLSNEEQFYLLWPLALVIGYRWRGQIAIGAIVFASLFRVAVILIHPTEWQTWVYYSFPGTMDGIASGCLLAVYESRFAQSVESAPSWLLVGLPFAAWLAAIITWSGVLTAFGGAVPLILAYWVLLAVRRAPHALNNSPMVLVGVLSYSIYLWQQPFTLVGSFPTIPALAMTLVCAVASYFLVERPMIRLGARTKTQEKGAPKHALSQSS